MRLASARPCAVRARNTVVAAVAGLVVLGAGLRVAGADARRGMLLAFLGLLLLHVALRRRQDLQALQALGDRRVGEIAEEVAVLRRYGSPDGLDELRGLTGHEVGVVLTDEGWRVLSRDDVADAVLSAANGRFSGDWSRYLRAVPGVDGDLPVSRLRRIPSGPEQWLVLDGGGPPGLLTVATVHRAARRRRNGGTSERPGRRRATPTSPGSDAARSGARPDLRADRSMPDRRP